MSAATWAANNARVGGKGMQGGRTSAGMAQPAECTLHPAPPQPVPHAPTPLASTHRAWRSRAGAPWTAACRYSPAGQCSWTGGRMGGRAAAVNQHTAAQPALARADMPAVRQCGSTWRFPAAHMPRQAAARPTIPRPHRKVNSASQSWPFVKALQSQASPVADRVGAATTWLNTSSRCCPPVVRGGGWEWKV